MTYSHTACATAYCVPTVWGGHDLFAPIVNGPYHPYDLFALTPTAYCMGFDLFALTPTVYCVPTAYCVPTVYCVPHCVSSWPLCTYIINLFALIKCPCHPPTLLVTKETITNQKLVISNQWHMDVPSTNQKSAKNSPFLPLRGQFKPLKQLSH